MQEAATLKEQSFEVKRKRRRSQSLNPDQRLIIDSMGMCADLNSKLNIQDNDNSIQASQ